MSLSLRYRDVFYHKVLRPSKLWALLEDLDSRISESNSDDSVSEDVEALETAIGDESTEGTILARLKALEDLKAAIGDESTKGTILARLKALEDAQ